MASTALEAFNNLTKVPSFSDLTEDCESGYSQETLSIFDNPLELSDMTRRLWCGDASATMVWAN
jgi:hypothetical protein